MQGETKGHPSPVAEAGLKKLKQRFEQWRRSREARNCPIPPDLLKAARGLVGPYRPGPLAKQLRLHYRRLTKKTGEGPRPKPVDGLAPAVGPTFVKWPWEAPRPVVAPGRQEPGVVEFENPRGYKARIYLGKAPSALVCRLLQSIGGDDR